MRGVRSLYLRAMMRLWLNAAGSLESRGATMKEELINMLYERPFMYSKGPIYKLASRCIRYLQGFDLTGWASPMQLVCK